MGTLANLYAIQQSFSTTKSVDKIVEEVKVIISADTKVNDNKQQLHEKSMYIVYNIVYGYHLIKN